MSRADTDPIDLDTAGGALRLPIPQARPSGDRGDGVPALAAAEDRAQVPQELGMARDDARMEIPQAAAQR